MFLVWLDKMKLVLYTYYISTRGAESGAKMEDDYDDYDYDWSDAEADADALASAGHGTDEDYGYFGGDE